MVDIYIFFILNLYSVCVVVLLLALLLRRGRKVLVVLDEGRVLGVNVSRKVRGLGAEARRDGRGDVARLVVVEALDARLVNVVPLVHKDSLLRASEDELADIVRADDEVAQLAVGLPPWRCPHAAAELEVALPVDGHDAVLALVAAQRLQQPQLVLDGLHARLGPGLVVPVLGPTPLKELRVEPKQLKKKKN